MMCKKNNSEGEAKEGERKKTQGGLKEGVGRWRSPRRAIESSASATLPSPAVLSCAAASSSLASSPAARQPERGDGLASEGHGVRVGRMPARNQGRNDVWRCV
eukprot:scaffold99349_cov28-Tisochrysis_lutea.AAC.1